MFALLKRPEDVQNKFVAVERGKSLTNPDYVAFILVVLFSRKSQTGMAIIGKREGWRLSPFSLESWHLMLFTRVCLPLGQLDPPLIQ